MANTRRRRSLIPAFVSRNQLVLEGLESPLIRDKSRKQLARFSKSIEKLMQKNRTSKIDGIKKNREETKNYKFKF